MSDEMSSKSVLQQTRDDVDEGQDDTDEAEAPSNEISVLTLLEYVNSRHLHISRGDDHSGYVYQPIGIQFIHGFFLKPEPMEFDLLIGSLWKAEGGDWATRYNANPWMTLRQWTEGNSGGRRNFHWPLRELLVVMRQKIIRSESGESRKTAAQVPAMDPSFGAVGSAESKPLSQGNREPRLRPSAEIAWSQYNRAFEANPALKTDLQVYDYYLQYMADESEKLPSFATWLRYVGQARKATGSQKNKRGIGHETRSIVHADRLDR